MKQQPKIIALDCDHVLLDYNKTWGNLYSNFFKKPITIANPDAYYAQEYWGVDWTDRDEELLAFNHHFTLNGWSDMDALDGAIEATHILQDNGYKIFVVTRMPESGEKARSNNLNKLGFKFDSVIGTGNPKFGNPKAPYIEALHPDYFVDDMIVNFVGIDKNLRTKFVWLDIGKEHYENTELKKSQNIHHTHVDLYEFVTQVIQQK